MNEKYYITTAIPYINDVPHIGHALEFIQADALARYHRQLGKDVLFTTGTDEHGGKVLEKAIESGLTPKEYADKISAAFKDFCSIADISYDRFVRTTAKSHMESVHKAWKNLSKYIYKGNYVGYYDQKEEEFITEEQAREIKKTDPDRFQRLQKTEEENYFFKLSEFTEKIKAAIQSDELRIVPQTRKREILSLLESGLEDISISRPTSKLTWGIPVPGDKSQVIYVWFEALLNYITVLGYPDGDDFKRYWPADTQVIGKDILRFHAAIWPAILLGLGLELPKDLYVHGFVHLENQKMSKSIGNVVSPLEIIEHYGSDALRYYLLRHIPSYDDGNFSWEKFELAYNGELANALGNLVQRVASMIDRYQEGIIGEIKAGEHDRGIYDEAMQDYRFDKAIDYVFNLIKGINQYIDEQKPWEIAKDPGESDHLSEVLSYASGSILQIGRMLYPFMPKTAQIIEKTFSNGVVELPETSLFPKKTIHTSKDERS